MLKTMHQTVRDYHHSRPATDILEREDGFYIYMDIPGVRREDLILDLQEDELTIQGKTHFHIEENEGILDRHLSESEYFRTISLSDIIDREGIKANLDNGVLEIHLPKIEKKKPKRIEVLQG